MKGHWAKCHIFDREQIMQKIQFSNGNDGPFEGSDNNRSVVPPTPKTI